MLATRARRPGSPALTNERVALMKRSFVVETWELLTAQWGFFVAQLKRRLLRALGIDRGGVASPTAAAVIRTALQALALAVPASWGHQIHALDNRSPDSVPGRISPL